MKNTRCDWIFLALPGATLRVVAEQEPGLPADGQGRWLGVGPLALIQIVFHEACGRRHKALDSSSSLTLCKPEGGTRISLELVAMVATRCLWPFAFKLNTIKHVIP